MRILYLHQYFTTPEMPGGTRSYEMASRLVGMGHQVDMVTSIRDGAGVSGRGWTVTEEAGIRVHWYPVSYENAMSYRQRAQAFARFAAASTRRAMMLDCDLVFATSTPLTIALPGIAASRRHHVPMVFEVRDLWPEMPIAVGALRNPLMIAAARRLERTAYSSSARVVALSPGMKRGVMAAGYPEDRISVIPNACDIELFSVDRQRGAAFRQQHEWLGDRPLVVYCGTLGVVNGVEYLARVAAAAAAHGSEARFLVVGSGGRESMVRQEAERLGVLSRNFFMLPSVPKRQVPDIYAAADVVTSLFDRIPEMEANSANKFFDGLAAGRPVAINYGGWQAELLRERGAGLVIDGADPEAGARELLRALGDRAWLDQAGVAARRLAISSFSRDDLARQLEAVLSEAASSGHRQRISPKVVNRADIS